MAEAQPSAPKKGYIGQISATTSIIHRGKRCHSMRWGRDAVIAVRAQRRREMEGVVVKTHRVDGAIETKQLAQYSTR